MADIQQLEMDIKTTHMNVSQVNAAINNFIVNITGQTLAQYLKNVK